MNKVFGVTSGRVVRAGQLLSKDGRKPFATCTIDHVREWNGKEFRSKVELVTYRDTEAIVEHLAQGAWVEASGDVQINKFEYNGKPCANLRIVGDISVVQPGAVAPRLSDALPPDDGDDVPF